MFATSDIAKKHFCDNLFTLSILSKLYLTSALSEADHVGDLVFSGSICGSDAKMSLSRGLTRSEKSKHSGFEKIRTFLGVPTFLLGLVSLLGYITGSKIGHLGHPDRTWGNRSFSLLSLDSQGSSDLAFALSAVSIQT